jgi:uncharacterized coiled-coil protein SlyX
VEKRVSELEEQTSKQKGELESLYADMDGVYQTLEKSKTEQKRLDSQMRQ